MISQHAIKKSAYWLLIIFGILGLYFVFKGQSNHHMQRKNIYLLGRDSSWYPLDLQGKNNNLTAFTNDLFDAVTKETGIRFQWVDTGPGSLVTGLDNKLYDGILSPMIPNAFNIDQYNFSDPIFRLGAVVIVKDDSKIKSFSELKGLTMGFKANSSMIYNAIDQTGSNVHDLILIPYPNHAKALEALIKHQVDSVIMDAVSAYNAVDTFYKGQIKIISTPLTQEGLRLITLNDPIEEELITKFNESLKVLKSNGTFKNLVEKWGLLDPEERHQQTILHDGKK